MNETDFTRRLETILERGMGSVPLPAAAPANARYRAAMGKVGSHGVPRFTVALAAIGLALLTSLVAVAASGASPAALESAAAHSIEVLIEKAAAFASGQPEPASPVREAVPGAGNSPTTSPTDRPSPNPQDSHVPGTLASPEPSSPEDPTLSPPESPVPIPSDSPPPDLLLDPSDIS